MSVQNVPTRDIRGGRGMERNREPLAVRVGMNGQRIEKLSRLNTRLKQSVTAQFTINPNRIMKQFRCKTIKSIPNPLKAM